MAGQAQHVVDRVVVKATDSGAAGACRLGFQIQHLSDDARLPEQLTVERRAEFLQARVELGEHAEAEESIGGDVLIAADARGEPPAVAASQPNQR